MDALQELPVIGTDGPVGYVGIGMGTAIGVPLVAAEPRITAASAVLFAGGHHVDVVFFQQLTSKDGSVQHSGDNLVGGTGQDDESILVDLQRVPAQVDQITFTVNSFTRQTFVEVQNAYCRLIDETTGQELARYTLTGGGHHTAQVMAKVYRSGGGWQMAALGELAAGRTCQDLLPAITRLL
ncbi:TerD family protein [Streptomyces sp. NPDC058394]|uniref:TerD family protein n=1 Tax=Streptomyces sp. NPDC058394 TaxID=3346477 RepID=UPI003660EC99